MRFDTTDGKERYKHENGACCSPDTAGKHQRDCPMAHKMEAGYRLLSSENAELAESSFLVSIEDWPLCREGIT